jgi:hypothetical protein
MFVPEFSANLPNLDFIKKRRCGVSGNRMNDVQSVDENDPRIKRAVVHPIESHVYK